MHKRSGFTLIEVMSSTAILSILLLGAITVFTTSLLSQSKSRVRRVLKIEGEQIISTIEFELKNAQLIEAATCDGSAQNSIDYVRAGDTTHTTRTIKQNGSDIQIGPTGSEENMNSNNVKTPTGQELTFVCEENTANKTKFITATFALTNAQAGEINTEVDGNIVESFRTGVSFRNFKAN